MTARKRPLSNEIDGDSLPLAKRIALLSVDSTRVLNEEDAANEAHQLLNNNYASSCYSTSQPPQLPWQQIPSHYHSSVEDQHLTSNLAGCSYQHPTSNGLSDTVLNKMTYYATMPSDGINIYKPELDSQLNPEYYDINSVLFHAHFSRIQRLGNSMPHQ